MAGGSSTWERSEGESATPCSGNTLDVDLVVVSAVTPERVGELVPELRQISHARRLAVGGAGAEGLEATALDALALTDDPVREAERVTALFLAAEH